MKLIMENWRKLKEKQLLNENLLAIGKALFDIVKIIYKVIPSEEREEVIEDFKNGDVETFIRKHPGVLSMTILGPWAPILAKLLEDESGEGSFTYQASKYADMVKHVLSLGLLGDDPSETEKELKDAADQLKQENPEAVDPLEDEEE